MAQFKADPRVGKLFAQMQGQRAKIAALGATPPTTHPSIISRIFDILSRPNYAVMNTFQAPAKAIQSGRRGLGIWGAAPGGFLAGLEGKAKTHTADVMQTLHDIHAPGASIYGNRVVRGVGGLIGDITTDPTTYMGGVFVKAIPAVEEGGAIAKAISAGMGKGVSAESLASTASNAVHAARVAAPGKLGIRIGTKELASTKAYDALAKVGRPIAQTRPVSTANELFRTAATYPGKLKSMMRVPLQSGVSDYINFDKAVMDRFGKLLPQEGRAVSHAIEFGTSLPGVSKHGIPYQDVIDFWKTHKAAWDAEQAAQGIKRTGQGIDHYLPKKFASHTEWASEKAQNFRKVERQVVATAAAKGQPIAAGSFPTLMDLKDAGLHPHENIVDIMRLAAADHQRAMAKSIFKTNAIDELGANLTGKGMVAARKAAEQKGLEVVPQKLLEGTNYYGKTVHAPEDVIRSFKAIDKVYQSDEATRKFMRAFDGMQRLWKQSVTTVNPGHHLRNMVGDAFLNFEAGVTDPRDYERAMKVLTGRGKVQLGGLSVDSDWIRTMYRKYGGASGFFNTELVGATTPGAVTEKLTRPINSGMEKMREIVAKREDYMRLANFTHSLRQEAAKAGATTHAEIEKLVPKAVERVKKFNFDYGDLTPFESNVRRWVPFYTFMRKNMPLQLEMMAMHPNRIASVPKGIGALQQLLGTDNGHMPITEMIPAYLKDLATVRVAGQGHPNVFSKLLGTGGNAAYADTALPVEDLSRMFSGSTSEVTRNMLNTLSPFIKGPIEVGTGTSLQSGQKLNESIPRYLGNQTQISRLLMNAVTPKAPNHILAPGEKTGTNQRVALSNWITGSGVKEITPQVQLSELRRQQDPLQSMLRQLKINRANSARKKRR